jgi:hypothetical protein
MFFDTNDEILSVPEPKMIQSVYQRDGFRMGIKQANSFLKNYLDIMLPYYSLKDIAAQLRRVLSKETGNTPFEHARVAGYNLAITVARLELAKH